MRLSECTSRIAVSGEHTRVSQRELIFDHTWDLPFTRTLVEVERDGKVERLEVVNSAPDWPRVLTASVLGVLGTAALGRFAVDVAAGEDPYEPELSWLPPVGAGLLLGAGALAATGWHPPSDTFIEGCARARSGDDPSPPPP